MASRVTTIVNGLIVTLQGITVANGYEASVVPKVVRRGLVVNTLAVRRPALIVVRTEVSDTVGLANRRLRSQLLIEVGCVSEKPGVDEATAWESSEALMEAVYRRVHEVPDLNGTLTGAGGLASPVSRSTEVELSSNTGIAWGLVTISAPFFENV